MVHYSDHLLIREQELYNCVCIYITDMELNSIHVSSKRVANNNNNDNNNNNNRKNKFRRTKVNVDL